MDSLIDRIAYDPDEAAIYLDAGRYMLIRPETLAAMARAVGGRAGDIFFSAGLEGGRLAARSYREQQGTDPKGIIEYMLAAGARIGWAKMELTGFSVEAGRFEVIARGDTLDWPGGSGWRLLAGILTGLGDVVFGESVGVEVHRLPDGERGRRYVACIEKGSLSKRSITYGRVARIGLIIPASNTVCEPDMVRLSPNGVSTHASRIMFKPTLESLHDMKNHVDRTARELSSEDVCDLIIFCCTVGSMIGGPDYDREISREISSVAGVPAITTTTAVKEAFRKMGINKVALVTPYTIEINMREKEVLEASGIAVAAMAGVHDQLPPEQLRNDMIGRLSPEEAYHLAMLTDTSEADAIFISCTNFQVLDVIERLEKETGKPVVTSNQATMWLALRTLNVPDRPSGYGRLFDL